MILLDVNVLVYAHREGTDRHEEYRRWLEEQLDSSTGCAVSDLALSGCLRIITHLVADAYHAALALETGAEWITTDRGYSRFPGLRCRHPLDR